MKQLSLDAISREATGKGAARTLRRADRIPAVLYGRGLTSRPLSVERLALTRLLEVVGGEAALVDVTIDGGEQVKALVREVQRNPIRRSDVIHLDLYAVTADQPITVDVPVHIIGSAEGVRNQGGVLDHHLHRITLHVLPGDIPEHIEVDVTNLTLGHAIHIADITVPNAEMLHDPDVSIVSVVVSRAEVAATPEVEAAPSAEPELIKKGKAEEEGEAEGEEAPEAAPRK
jgi:large subunit ribosomal protein L25